MRKLATIRIIQSINPIAGKDRVEMATVDGWTCMVSKADGFTVGTKCIFCEPDSVFPATDQWEFLKKYNYRIKTQKFKDGNKQTIYSQGLVLPLSILPKVVNLEIGDDVTKELGITQWEDTMDREVTKDVTSKKYPKWLMRFGWFRKLVTKKKTLKGFPSFIAKTDEERIQNCYEFSQSEPAWVATEKVDGQSGTFLVMKSKSLFNKYEYHVYSRNYENNDPNSSYNIVFNKYNLKDVLTKLIEKYNWDWVAIQGECIGPSIQKNKYKVKECDLFAFNLVTPAGRYSTDDMVKELVPLGVKCVPVLTHLSLIGKSCDEILNMANGKSELNKDSLREGIVFRSLDGKKSFKAVSPEFLAKNDE